MDWFQGELGEAISSVKTSKKMLLVFVYGKDEDPSKEFFTSLEACADATKNYLCLKLEASSLGAAQLNAFYPVMVVPLIYIINHDGNALESICGRATTEEIRSKLSSAERLVKGDGTSPKCSTISKAEKPENPSSPSGSTDEPDAGAGPSAEDLEARRAAAQEQLLEIRLRKEREEKEKEKEKEKERREVGQRMAELKRFQREQELKDLREEIEKKRKDEREVRDRIRRQIEEDRRERMARNAVSSASSSPSASVSASATTSTASASTAADGDTRLQFRLPDGSNIVHIFRSTAPLREAYDFITRELNGRLGRIRISSLYPRRLFGPDDMEISLLDLALAPSAALVVMSDARGGDVGARTGGVPASSGGGSVVQFAMMPLVLLWGILCSIFAALLALVRRPTPAPASAPPGNNARTAQRERRVGGINRLSDLPRDDDDANTWNGNSTQQE